MDLRAYAAVIRRRKWTIVLVVMPTVGAALFFSIRQTPLYRSSARVLVRPLNPNQVLQGYSYAVSKDTEAALVASPKVGGNIVGGVFNNFDPSNAKTYPGAYRYYTSYGYYAARASPPTTELARPTSIRASSGPDLTWGSGRHSPTR